MRRCAVCEADLDALGKRKNALTCSGACRAAKSRQERHVTYVAKAHSAPGSRAKRAPDMRIAFTRAVDTVAGDYEHGWHMQPSPARARARHVLQDCLTPRQLDHLKRAA